MGFWSSVFGIGNGLASGDGGEVIKSSLELLEEYRSSRRNAAMQAQMLAMLQQQEAESKLPSREQEMQRKKTNFTGY